MPEILVTGGAGYIGSHTCVELLNSGYDVVVIDNHCNSKPNVLTHIENITRKKLTSYHADIRDPASLKSVFMNHKIEAVIHFAGLKAVAESVKIPVSYYQNNVCGTITLCDAMQNFGVKKLIFSSSATVYGTASISPYKEDMPCGGINSPYGRTKYAAETFLTDLHASGDNWEIITLLRYFNPIGAHESGLIGDDPNGIPNNLMPYIARVAAGQLPFITVFGNDYNTPDGTCVRDYIHVKDLALGHISAMQKKQKNLGIYNLGSGCGYSVMQIINAFEEATGQKINYQIGPRRSGDIASYYANTQKAELELGFKANADIKKMCADTWNYQVKRD